MKRKPKMLNRVIDYFYCKIFFKKWILRKLKNILKINFNNVYMDYVTTIDEINEIINTIEEIK